MEGTEDEQFLAQVPRMRRGHGVKNADRTEQVGLLNYKVCSSNQTTEPPKVPSGGPPSEVAPKMSLMV